VNYLARLASNFDPPDLCLLSSEDYKHEPLAPGKSAFFASTKPNSKSQSYQKKKTKRPETPDLSLLAFEDT
jgi:hypothetical protein